eukprot:Skav215965  [mRNA]  locus=scaffold498:4687:6057:- [translate_table: standard]
MTIDQMKDMLNRMGKRMTNMKAVGRQQVIENILTRWKSLTSRVFQMEQLMYRPVSGQTKVILLENDTHDYIPFEVVSGGVYVLDELPTRATTPLTAGMLKGMKNDELKHLMGNLGLSDYDWNYIGKCKKKDDYIALAVSTYNNGFLIAEDDDEPELILEDVSEGELQDEDNDDFIYTQGFDMLDRAIADADEEVATGAYNIKLVINPEYDNSKRMVLSFNPDTTTIAQVIDEIIDLTNLPADSFVLLDPESKKSWDLDEYLKSYEKDGEFRALIRLIQRGGGRPSTKKDKEDKQKKIADIKALLEKSYAKANAKISTLKGADSIKKLEGEIKTFSDMIEAKGVGNAFDCIMEKLDVAQLSGVIARLDASVGNPDYKLKKASVFMFGDSACEVEKNMETSQLLLDSLGSAVLYAYTTMKTQKEDSGETFTLTHFKKIVELKCATKMGAQISANDAML